MLHISFIRENPQLVRDSLKKRKDREKLHWVDDLLKKDQECRRLLAQAQELRTRRNLASQEINALQKAGKDIRGKVAEVKAIPDKIKAVEDRMAVLQENIRHCLMRIPNILHESVPVGDSEKDNVVVKKWGKPGKADMPPHGEWLEQHGQADFSRAAKVAGAGFYYLKDKMALLDLALQRFAVGHLLQKGFTLIQPPLMMNRAAYEGVIDIADFQNVMYKAQDEDLYLIATSEHPMVAMFKDEVLEEKALPIKLVGISPCFRKEIGSHGVDTRGLFRVHQFNKVEQVIICRPEDSWQLHEEIQKNTEEIVQQLGIPYRVVNICTADIGSIAAKKYDIEAWFPREQAYREITSASNCTSYQAVRLNIRCQKGQEREYVHTLNNTALATGRIIRAIIENFQQEDGSMQVPEALQKYMDGIKRIE
ncbi:MAG TPA: serine--tRNA ligase [Candidatus Nanoarchaeia archaeon]|nr:serine--tRNA ligase [Candidatus Nanoarchaeia archaeon]